jgi:DNA-binding NtrC family response regulator
MESMTPGSRRFTVEIRTTYEISAENLESALRSVPPAEERCGLKPLATEYVLRERAAPLTPAFENDASAHGLDKPVYSVSEAASILGTSRSTLYEKIQTRGRHPLHSFRTTNPNSTAINRGRS